MKFSLNILFLLLALVGGRSQGSVSFQYDTLFEQLESDLRKGHKRSLRDLGSLLDNKATSQKARAILKKTTFFTPEEIDVNNATRAEFLAFYYDNESKMIYSEMLQGFYLTPLENRTVNFSMQSTEKDAAQQGAAARHLYKQLDDLITSEDFQQADEILTRIKETQSGDYQLLFSLLQDERLYDAPADTRKAIYQNILTQLQEFPEFEVAEITLQMWEGGFVEEPFAEAFLIQFLNCKNPGSGESLEFYQHLADSLGTLDDIRRHGYETVFAFKLNFFQFPVDYYGKILCRADTLPWISENVLLDLKRTQHPRALFYLAAYLYRNRLSANSQLYDYCLQLLHSLTNVEIGVANENGQTTFSPKKEDETAVLNYLMYWAAHYTDYEWDENRHIFTNKLESLAKTQNYEKLFRRLNSRNDSVALNSFLQLTQGDPVEINALAKKFRQLLRNHNEILPSLKYQYLEQLTLLTDFCTKNNFQYKSSKKLKELLDQLFATSEVRQRYAIENQLIRELKIENVTVLEYWACLHEGNKALTFSAGRILDWFYSKNWSALINDNDHLRFYLKKAALFERIGVSGICNSYLNKFDMTDQHQRDRLKELEKIEVDEDIINQISLLLEFSAEQTQSGHSLDAFLEDPTEFRRRDIKILPAPSLAEAKQIIERIRQAGSTEEIKNLFTYLRLHPQLEFIPDLFQLSNDQRVIVKRNDLEITVSDHIVPILESVYNYKFTKTKQDPYSISQWIALWERDGINYENWGIDFYTQKLDSLKYNTELSIDDLNQLAESPNYREEHKALILKNLSKVKPLKNIRRLALEPKLSVAEDLQYFQNFFFSYKELDDIPKLFEVRPSDVPAMLKYLDEKSANFSFSERGSFYNNLFQFPWLVQYLNGEQVDVNLTETIKSSLDEYLNESDFLSEYEEQVTIMNIAQIDNIGRSLEEKLLSTLRMDADVTTKNKVVNEIIATISYSEIGTALANYKLLNNEIGDEFFAFLHRDFGLPVFNIKSQNYLDELLDNHANLSEYEFYLHYLKAFGVDFLDEKGALDFQKISDILQFDIISPFVGEHGGKRDDYSYGIIKLLELKFGTRLGFHEKLNEAQTFYRFSSSGRAQAWIKYLREQKLIDPELASPPSFNQVKQAM